MAEVFKASLPRTLAMQGLLPERPEPFTSPDHYSDLLQPVLGSIKTLPARPGLGAASAKLHQHGFRTMGATNGGLETTRGLFVNAFGEETAKRWEFYSCDEDQIAKPAPPVYAAIRKRLGLQPGDECWFVAAHTWCVLPRSAGPNFAHTRLNGWRRRGTGTSSRPRKPGTSVSLPPRNARPSPQTLTDTHAVISASRRRSSRTKSTLSSNTCLGGRTSSRPTSRSSPSRSLRRLASEVGWAVRTWIEGAGYPARRNGHAAVGAVSCDVCLRSPWSPGIYGLPQSPINPCNSCQYAKRFKQMTSGNTKTGIACGARSL